MVVQAEGSAITTSLAGPAGDGTATAWWVAPWNQPRALASFQEIQARSYEAASAAERVGRARVATVVAKADMAAASNDDDTIFSVRLASL